MPSDAHADRVRGGDPAAMDQAALLAQRYGRRGPGQRPWWRRPLPVAALVVLGLLACAYGVWVAVATSAGPSWTDVSHEIRGDGSVRVTFAVTRPAGTAVSCPVHALDANSSEVGLARVDVPAGGAATAQETIVVRTTSRPVTAEVASCAAVDGSRS